MAVTGIRGFHLSTQQARIWSLQSDEKQIYETQCAIQISGTLDLDMLLQAVQQVVNRQSILRTSFLRLAGMDVPVQVINERVKPECVIIDLEHLQIDAHTFAWQSYFPSTHREHIEETQSPLLHLSLLRLAKDTHILHLSLPSLCADERTLILFLTELSQAYGSPKQAGFSNDEEEEPVQYVDAAAWQDELLQEEEAEPHRRYWQKMDLTQATIGPLPVQEQGHDVIQKREGEAFTPLIVDIPVETTTLAQINQVVERLHISFATYILACWYVSCFKLTQATPMTMGLTCDGRFHEELQAAFGLYKRVVPLTLTLMDRVRFEQVLLLMQTVAAEAYEEQLYFAWEESLTKAKEVAAYFPVSFEYERWPETLVAEGLTFSLLRCWNCTEPFVLKLNARQVGERVQMELHYDPARVTGEQAHTLANLFGTFLTNATTHPQASIGTLSLLSQQQQTQLLTTFSAPQRAWERQTLTQLFEAQVQQHPNALAVISPQEQMSYQQLDARATHLASRLRQRRVGPNVLVGLCLSRQAAMLVGLLGILKAGGAYLPLEPGNPTLRLNYQLQESGARLFLTQDEYRGLLPDWTEQTLYLEELEAERPQAIMTPQAVEGRGEDLAYVIYTSGSTGTPKGVMVQQRNVANYTQAICERLGAEPGWQYATVSTLAADLGNTAIFCALASGGCIQVLDYEMVTSGETMAAWIEQHPIDVLKIVPSHLSALLESPRALELLPKRALVLGGEALPQQLLERVRQVGGECRIYNHYGPTETTIGVLVNTVSTLGKEEAEGDMERQQGQSTVALGRPIANTQVYVLDQALQLVPQGVVGELYIGGASVAIGYMQQAAQTAERFIPHPYSAREGERLYRTGDLVRYGKGDLIEFVGRRDRQVKLRGYRIEPGEIEAVLRQHPWVRDCAVSILQTETTQEARLIGYVVSKQRAQLSNKQLEQWLEQRLPAYMVPTEYVQIDEIPLTANGKVDRARLPSPTQRILERASESVAPRSPLEEMVAQIWQDLLGVATIGVHDNFFALGGHSLLATRVIARLQAQFQVALPVQQLFDAPTVAELAQQIERQLREGEALVQPPLVAEARPETLPLSFAQQRLWFLDQLEPESPTYLIPMALRVLGNIAVQSLERSFEAIIDRHESLRTRFVTQEGQPRQIIDPSLQVVLPLIDLSGLGPDQREETTRQLASQEAQQTCDLATGPLLRTSLLRLAHDVHVLLLTLHHIITDGWSNEVLVRELSTLYRAFVTGAPAPLAPLPLQYADYALWQRGWLQGRVLEAQLDYWRNKLTGAPPLDLLTDYPRPAVQTYRGASIPWHLPRTVTEALRAFSQQENVTMFMLLLASFQALLLRYSGQSDISVGTPIANRRQAEVEEVMGFFVNTLVLRTDLSGNPSFVELLQRVREVCLGAYTHQDVPFEQVVEELEIERDLSRSPLFQVLFVLQNVSQERGEVAGVQIHPLEVEQTVSKFDLSLVVTETEQGMRGILEYRTDLFKPQTMQRMLNHWQRLLEGVLYEPQMALWQLPLLSEGEQTQILTEWNATRADYPQELGIHQLFEQQVQRTPEAIALVYEKQQLTYHELNRRANQLAEILRQRQIGADMFVGIYMERSLELVIGLLGVLKAGAAYIPLEPSLPPARLRVLLQDAQPALVLTQEQAHLNESLGDVESLQVSMAVLEQQAVSQSKAQRPFQAEQLVSLIYTSGSTGVPKGVMNVHRGLVNRLTWMQERYQLQQQDRVLQKTPMSFDVSEWEFFWPLSTGARLVIAQPGGHQDPFYLKELIEQEEITTVHFVPSMLQAFLLEPTTLQACQKLRRVICSGEALSVPLVTRFFAHAPASLTLHNLYGPTEASVDVTAWECLPDGQEQSIPIGHPIANTQLYILDRMFHPVPIGVIGDLYIGGVGLARGYFGRPELTAERFVPDPWGARWGARLYQTGDLARYRADGAIEFLGRSDHQVKIHGQRIELGEIETILSTHPGVQECVVVASEDPPADKRLLAYVVARAGQAPSHDELRLWLQGQLPGSMQPAAFISQASLPLSPTGKIDRKALPQPEQLHPERSTTFVRPQSPSEVTLASIWSQLLKVEQVGIHDNFFALGGDSILSIQVVARARTAGLQLTPKQLFQQQTIAQLAQVVTGTTPNEAVSADASLVTLEPEQLEALLHQIPQAKSERDIEDILPLSPMQAGLLFHSLYTPEAEIYGIHMQGSIQGELKLEAWYGAWQQVIERHSLLRTLFVWNELPQPLQVVLRRIELPGELLDWRDLTSEQQQERLRKLTQATQISSQDLSTAPLLRVVLVRLQEQRFVFHLSIHHLLVDGWSQALLLAEVYRSYEALSHGKQPALPPVRPYRDYLAWLLKRDQREAEQFWRTYLHGIHTPTSLPERVKGVSRAWPQVAIQQVTCSEEISQALWEGAQQLHITLNTLVQGAWALLLSRYSGEKDVLFGATTTGRPPEMEDVETMMGIFINTLPVRVHVPQEQTVQSWLRELQSEQVEARQYEYTPLVQIQEWSEIPARQPLFESLLIFQNYPKVTMALEAFQEVSVQEAVTREQTHYPLMFKVVPSQAALQLSLQYDETRFDAEWVGQLLEQVQVILQALVEQPHQQTGRISLLSEQERQHLLSWNKTHRAYTVEMHMHQLFEQQVERTPDAIALTFEGQHLTYHELNRRANQLAHYLQRRGVGPDRLVGLCMERSLELIIGLLGVFKAGGAYVPLDPTYPQDRLTFMMEDAQLAIVLTDQEPVREQWRADGRHIVSLTTQWQEIARKRTENPTSEVSAENLAYVIYTSGSTGTPKGTMISHYGLSHVLTASIHAFEIEGQTRLLQHASMSFDNSIWEIGMALVGGATLCLGTQETLFVDEQLAAFLERQAITTAILTPSVLGLLPMQPFPSLQTLMVGGESCPADLAARWAVGRRFLNTYGPTEATIHATYYENAATPVAAIGRSNEQIEVYLLDEQGELVPRGVIGELHLGGVGVARGYFQRPALTAERFVPNPFSMMPGERLYRTGDLGRYLATGDIEFLGRADQQVKMHGVRIELGEIEAVLHQHPDLQECAVVLREDQAGEKRLVAYVATKQEGALNSGTLRAYLQAHLPASMLPSTFVILDTLPLTPNGKVDRRALPQPEERAEEDFAEEEDPRTPIEDVLIGIWGRVLGRRQVGRHSNFFELGGHSLLATQLIGQVRKLLAIEIPLRTIFEYPTIATFAQHVEEELRHENGITLPPLVTGVRPEVLPLSFAQQRLWFLDQLEPGSATYLVPVALRVEGEVEVQSLEYSWLDLMYRHESLHTTFTQRAGQPIQVIQPVGDVPLPVIDLQELRPEQREQEARRLAHQEARQPCDMAQGPLARLSLLRLQREEHALLLTLHHIITDGWSNEILIRELVALYRAFVTREPSPLAPMPIQYADYALWQRRWLQGAELEAQLAYWRTHLAGSVPLGLPTDYPRPAVQTYRGAVQILQCSPALSERLVALSRQEDVTLFMLLLAAFQTLMMRYSGQRDISVGTPIANRRHAELEEVIGFFTNTLVLHADLAGNPSFIELLQRVREICLGAYAHQDLPFEQVVEALEPVRDLSRSPLFQVQFLLQNMSPEVEELSGIRVSSLNVEHVTSKFDLVLVARETEQGLYCVLEYNTALFEAQTIQRLLHYWQNLLIGIVDKPHARLNDFALLSPVEQEQLLRDWRETHRPYPQRLCAHQIFEQQAQQTPDAVALVFEAQTLSYGELNRRANQLAHVLQGRGVGPEGLVGLYVQRSLEMIISVLAILKAGGAYVPLDPGIPAERLTFILQDTQLSLLLTQQTLSEKIPAWSGTVLELEQVWRGLSSVVDTVVESPVTVEQMAYVIYTSGSTGEPKGVQVTHRGLGNLGARQVEAFGIEAGSHVLQFASLSFDASVWEMLMALLSGASLHLAQAETLIPGPDLATLLREQAISAITLPPSALAALPEEALPDLRTLIVAGEPCPVGLMERWSQGRHFFNAYGPTEATVCATLEECFAGQEQQTLSLGSPLANTQVYLLDPWLQPTPPGVVGELYLAGPNLARGYLQRPEQTAEHFVPHPWSEEAGARMYRTGDRARYRWDGSLEFVGRRDQQIKLRGYRIEMGEIEATLGAYPDIQEAVVQVREDRPGDKRLVAYIVTQSGRALDKGALQSELQERLPVYMLPGTFVFLQALPLTITGKVDRQALQEPEEPQEGLALQTDESRTPIEELLTGVWCEVLDLTQVGVNDNFFELGGHSLLATQLISQVRLLLSVEIPQRAIFEVPTIAGFAQRIEEAIRLEQGITLPPLVAGARPEHLPLSFAQQRLWFLDQLEPESTAYLVPLALRVDGVVDGRALERSLEQLIRRHESLRTTFAQQAGQPIQVIRPAGRFTLPVIDLSGLEQAERQQFAQQLANQEAQRPVDLTQGPLLRAALLRLRAGEHVLFLTLHHIITDGWSNGVLVRELSVLYRTFVIGKPSPLAPLPLQYAEYALWQRSWLQGEVLEAQLRYWLAQLAGAPLLALPIDYPRPPMQTYRGASETWQLPLALSQAIQELSQQEQVTVFMTLLASFQVLLLRYSGQSDISVGTPIANRQQAEIEGVVGFFINTLVLRTDLAGNPDFLEVLQRVREVCLGAYAHQDVPFEQVVEAVEPVRDLSRSPLFQVLFTLQNVPQEENAVAGVQISALGTEQTSSKFDLSLTVTETEQGLHGSLQYNTDLFEPQTIQRMLRHWQTVLEGMVSDPQCSIWQVSLLTEAEQNLLVEGFNATAQEYNQELGIHQRFEQQVEHTPDAIALVFEDQQVSYRELNCRANQLAHRLRKLGVGPETLVGLCLERSVELVIGLLAILKAGGAYVPLDPAYPQQRLTFMLADAQISLLLIHPATTHVPQMNEGLLALDLQREWGQIADERDDNPSAIGSMEQMAYVIYTSGSTGRPKGVMNTHRGLGNHLAWRQETYHLQPGDRLVQKTPFSFDISVWEFFWPLLTGACLVMAQPGGHQDPTYLRRLIAEQQITTIHFVPTMLHIFLQEPDLHSACSSLRYVMCSGEAISAELQAEFFSHFSEAVQLHNLYGPTEASIEVSFWQCQRDRQATMVPIGSPIANTQMYILDQHLQPVPIGVAAELYIGGRNLARGYLKRADLTAERFIAHPFGAEPGARLYRTGDLARRLPDGTIEYLGRMDQQVKIRGYRIELEEIESVLRTHPEIRDCVVLAREEQPGEKQLVAYLVGQPGPSLSNRELRGYLQSRLPFYMLPSAFVVLEAMPLTPNGKLDRQALPRLEVKGEEEKSLVVQEPKTPVEELLLGLWKQVLGERQVGRHDNFFTLGGHSLLATQLIGRVRQTFAIEVPLRTVFEAPTVAEFAQRVELIKREGEGLALPPIKIGERPQELQLSFAQQRLWFLDQLETESSAYLIPLALRVRGDLEVAVLERSIETLIERHESLRTLFVEHEGQPVQIIQPAGRFTLPVIDLSRLELAERERLARRLANQEAQRPVDLTRGPLLRAALLRLQAGEHVLFLTLHHIITDGWSNEIVISELSALYRAFVADQVSPLAPLPLQYADYALWQRSWLQGEVLEAQLRYWRSQLAGAPLLALPTDHPRPPMQTYRGASLSWMLSLPLSQAIKHLSQQEQVTVFMTLLASFQVLLLRYSGQSDISVGTPIANRQQAEIEGVVGFFVNTLVLRTDLSGNSSFLELLQRVREVCLGAYAHQDAPFEQVVEAVEPKRDLSRSPLFQVFFALQNVPQEAQEVAGIQISALVAESITSKFDLMLFATETPQGLRGVVEYNADLFEKETIQRMLEHWQMLLNSLLENPRQAIQALALLPKQERDLLLHTWNATQREAPAQQGLQQLFEEQAQRTPDVLALAVLEEQLSYAVLNQRANQLAHLLQQRGVGPEQVVGICMERSIELLVGVLAVLKAGGTYLPLDISTPSQRLHGMLNEALPQIILTQRPLVTLFAATETFVPPLVLCLDEPQPELMRYPTSKPTVELHPDHPAYVIYTSGSTGQPKGVQLPHRALLNLYTWQARTLPTAVGTRVLQFTSPSFDVSNQEMFTTWQAGGTLVVLPRDEMRRDPETMLALLTEQQIERIFLPYVALQQLALTAEQQRERSLKLNCIITAGEQLQCTPAIRAWIESLPGCVLYNHYGPSETHVVTSYRLEGEPASWPLLPPIGRPIDTTQTYILDAHGQVVPIGVTGELFLGGDNLARGYQERADLTAERFVPHPFSMVGDERLYRTGDLARYLPNGEIEYLGRRDQQIKVRGYRVEIGEIEIVLGQVPGVQEAVGAVGANALGDTRLVAYVVKQPDATLTSRELRLALQERLPAYMLPTAFVFLAALPLLPNGKVDRQHLPAWEETEQEEEEQGQAGVRTPLEELLQGIWSQVLKQPQPGRRDNFFEVGGHSLLATQLIGRVRQTFAIELPLRTVFEAPTLAEFAQRVEQAMREGKGLMRPPLGVGKRPQEIPLSFAQQRLWFLDQLEPSSTTYLMPIALQITGAINAHALERSVAALLQRHESLRTTFIQHGEEPVQVIHPVGAYCLPVIDLSHLERAHRDREAQHLAAQERQRPSDLAQGPLLRSALIRLQVDEHVFLFTLHHIITDGWSNSVFVREMTSFYRAFATGEHPVLPPLPVQYADYALWQRQWLQGEVLQQHLEYWKKQLWRAQPLELPRDLPRTTERSNVGAVASLQCSAELTRDLVHLSQQEGVTLFMLLLSIFQVLLSRLSGQTDIVVGTDVANRNHVETEGLIGFFVNLLALRTDLQGATTFHQVAQQVRAMVMGAYSHQELPFEMVVEQVQGSRQEQQDPLVQAIFVMQNTPQEEEELAGIMLKPMSATQVSARFDLAVFASETERGLWLQAVYRTSIFREATVARLLARFERLARSVVEAPHASISSLEFLSEEEAKARESQEGTLYQKGRAMWGKRKRQAIDLSEQGSQARE